MDTVLSGIRSTGHLHLGNYFGALRNFVRMQHENRCFFFIADYHSLTTHPDPGSLHANVKDILCEYLAVGIDPEVATIYVQSDVPETVELYLLLNMHAYMGELAKTTSFKEKARKQPENVNAGLLTYPTLMAADILQHNADKVPVGKDQEQHLELTRRFARRFNNLYEVNFFTEPKPYNFDQELIKIPGLDGSGKMGKSEGNCIFLCEEPKLIQKKVVSTDRCRATGLIQPCPIDRKSLRSSEKRFQPRHGGLFRSNGTIAASVTATSKNNWPPTSYLLYHPIRERYLDICNNDEYLHKVAVNGAEKARASAAATCAKWRHIMGIRPF